MGKGPLAVAVAVAVLLAALFLVIRALLWVPWREARLAEEIARLSSALGEDLRALEREEWSRTPLPGPPGEDAARDWYAKASRTLHTDVDAAALRAWQEDLTPLPEEVRRFVARFQPELQMRRDKPAWSRE